MSQRKLGAELAHMLKARGVDTIFGIPGVHNIELYRGIEQAGITHILARNEQGAGFMADGYARATGRPGVAFVISGPGLTNIMTPMGQAYSDSVPMLVISSCLDECEVRKGQLHQMRDQLAAAATVCDWSHLAQDADSAFQLIERALTEFACQRARPKHIQIPIGVLGGPAPAAPKVNLAANLRPVAPDHQYDEAAKMLSAARKPVMIFGAGARRCADEARRVIARSGAVVFTSFAGRGVPAADDPLNCGGYLGRDESARILEQADLLVAVGTELAEVDLWRQELGHTCPLIRIDLDASQINRPVAALKIIGDAGAALAGIADHLPEAGTSDWDAAVIAKFREQSRAQTDRERPNIAPLVDAMMATLPPETMYYSDMTQFAYVANEVCMLDRPGHWHHPTGFGTLGYALPAAIGGKVARSDLATVAIAGDSGFQYTMQELGVAAELKLTLPIILWDNGKLKEIEDCMIGAQIAPNAVVALNPDFALLAAAYRVAYVKPETVSEFKSALSAALIAGRPTIIHVTPETSSSS